MSVTGSGNWDTRIAFTDTYFAGPIAGSDKVINCRQGAAIPLSGVPIPYFDGPGDVTGNMSASARGIFKVNLDYSNPATGLPLGSLSFQVAGGSVSSDGSTADYSPIPGSEVNCQLTIHPMTANTSTGLSEPYLCVLVTSIADPNESFVFLFHPISLFSPRPVGGTISRAYSGGVAPIPTAPYTLSITCLEPTPTLYRGYSLLKSA
jgi:hypothetical protein